MSRIFRIAEMYHHEDDSPDNDDLTTTLDLGGAGAVPVTHGYVAMTVDGADAYTLADGKPGQILVLDCVAQSVGAATLTPSRATGFTSVEFAGVGDVAVLLYVNDITGWILLSVYGITGTVPVVV